MRRPATGKFYERGSREGRNAVGLKPLGVLSASLVMLWAMYAAAQVAEGDVAAGRRLVQARCGGCHAIAPRGDKSMSFSAIAHMPATTSLSLHAFLLTPHPTMPNYRLTPAEIDNVVAFILSLRRS